MEVYKCFLFTFVLVFGLVYNVGSSIASKKKFDTSTADCKLSLNVDFGKPSPVFIQDGGRYLVPNTKKGDIELSQLDTILVACPGDKGHIVLGNISQQFENSEANCIAGSMFRMGSWVGQFKDIKCNKPPQYTVEATREKCAKGNTVYRVGYKVKKKFYTLYRACFDDKLLTTLYVKHELTPSSKFLQNGSRPQFSEGDLFGEVRMSELYRTASQKDRIDELLGPNMEQYYITKNQFLTRGHLAPRADFPLHAAQRASFHYINTAPQWMRGNAGDWAALEDGLRRRLYTYNSTVTVYTGTHGVVTLLNAKGQETEVYLAADHNGNGIVPVPLYFYKVVYDPRRRTAAAFISINSSYYNQTAIKNLSFCADTCYGSAQYPWLRWRSDGTHSFCCDYQEFVERVDTLPNLDVQGSFH